MYLLAIYDIAHPRRLQKVARVFEDYGIRVQKSKFHIYVYESNFRELRGRISEIIDPDQDGVKYIPLCESCRAKQELIGQGRCVDPEQEYEIL